jgi:hypothetical protein
LAQIDNQTIDHLMDTEESAFRPRVPIALYHDHGSMPIRIIDCVSDSLLAAEIFLSRLDRRMSKQKLDLLQLPTGNMA